MTTTTSWTRRTHRDLVANWKQTSLPDHLGPQAPALQAPAVSAGTVLGADWRRGRPVAHGCVVRAPGCSVKEVAGSIPASKSEDGVQFRQLSIFPLPLD